MTPPADAAPGTPGSTGAERATGTDGAEGTDPPDSGAAAGRRRARVLAGVGSVVAASALAALSVVVAGGEAGAWELTAVRTATDVTDVVGLPVRAVMQLGTFGAAVVLALVTAGVTRRHLHLAAVLASATIALALSNRLKAVVERDRPDGVRLREAQDGFGYPSSHTAVAFGLALVVAALLPRRWRWAPPALALVVGLGRMHVGVHYPLDVAGGALAGTAVALAVVALADPAHRRRAER